MSVFRLDAATIATAHGCVSCSQCGETFNSIATLTDNLPEEPFEALPLNQPSIAPPLLLQSFGHEHPPQQLLFDAAANAGYLDDFGSPHGDCDPETAAILSRHLQPATTSSRTSSRRLIYICVVLSLVLVVQLAWAERSTLMRNPSAAALMRSACSVLVCQLPLSRDLGKLDLVSRDIRRHPSVADALIISATVRNNARFDQPWPVVTIVLSDLDDRRIAMRRFTPAEYLHDPDVRKKGLTAGDSAALVFEVGDPGRAAVAFEFSFQ